MKKILLILLLLILVAVAMVWLKLNRATDNKEFNSALSKIEVGHLAPLQTLTNFPWQHVCLLVSSYAALEEEELRKVLHNIIGVKPDLEGLYLYDGGTAKSYLLFANDKDTKIMELFVFKFSFGHQNYHWCSTPGNILVEKTKNGSFNLKVSSMETIPLPNDIE